MLLTHLRRIELGAQLALLERTAARWPTLRKGARDQTARWGPTLLQLEVGGLALAHDFAVEFEPPLASGNVGDVLLTGPFTMLVEATTVHPPADESTVTRFWGKVTLRFADLHGRYGVTVSGSVAEVVSDEALDSWFHEIEPVAAEVSGTDGRRLAPSPGGGEIVIAGGLTGEEDVRLEGPAVQIDEWGRLASRIAEKAGQGRSDWPLWIRIDDGPWLWLLSFPASSPREQVHATLADGIRQAIEPFPHVAGVIVTNPPVTFGFPPGLTEEWSLAEQAVGVLRYIRQGCGREAVLVPGRHQDGDAQLAEWLRWYGDEAGWIDWALKTLGYPRVDELIERGGA